MRPAGIAALLLKLYPEVSQNPLHTLTELIGDCIHVKGSVMTFLNLQRSEV
jgi:hypothetical protein